MYRPSRRRGLSLLVCFAVATPLPAALVPADLRCEYLIKPLAIESPEPRLSWILHADPAERGQAQTAYRVLVASSPDLLNRDEGDLWDSGRAASDRTIHVVYAGRPLASSVRCYWKVQVWDAHGRASPWSAPATWSMGLLRRADWKAQWIADATPPSSKAGMAPATMLRKEFQIGGPIRRATIYATGLGLYELRLNGRRVGDQLLAPEWTRYSKRIQYQTYDVTELLRPGANCVAATLGEGWWAGPLMLQPAMVNPVFRLLLRMEIERADGSVADRRERSVVAGHQRRADPAVGHLFRRDLRRHERAARLGPTRLRRRLATRSARGPTPRNRCLAARTTSRSASSRNSAR